MRELNERTALACSTGKDYANNPESNESMVFLLGSKKCGSFTLVNIGTQ
jgi:hypothetical protein